MQAIFKLTATLAAGLFTGAAFFVLFVEHPARLECGASLAVQEFTASYRRAAIMQPALAILGFLAGVLVWLWGASFWWLFAGACLGSVIPFTLIWMLSLNKQLHDPALDEDSARAMELLIQWGRLHRGRCFIGLGSFLLFLALLKWV